MTDPKRDDPNLDAERAIAAERRAGPLDVHGVSGPEMGDDPSDLPEGLPETADVHDIATAGLGMANGDALGARLILGQAVLVARRERDAARAEAAELRRLLDERDDPSGLWARIEALAASVADTTTDWRALADLLAGALRFAKDCLRVTNHPAGSDISLTSIDTSLAAYDDARALADRTAAARAAEERAGPLDVHGVSDPGMGDPE